MKFSQPHEFGEEDKPDIIQHIKEQAPISGGILIMWMYINNLENSKK